MSSPDSACPPEKASRLKLIVIHGVGGTFADAVAMARDLLAFDCAWRDGDILVPRRVGTILRRLLQQPDAGRYAEAFQKLVLSQFLAAPPDRGTWSHDESQTARFRERRLRDEFPSVGLPVSPGPRQRRAQQLAEEARRSLTEIRPVLDRLADALCRPDGTRLNERDARSTIRDAVPEGGDELVAFMESLRDMQETGGDLDTVASAALYAYWLLHRERGSAPPVYGRDYRFVFLNYHEDLSHLDVGRPADVLMADLPIGAFPEFENQARRLSERGMHIERYEDHHPYTAEHVTMFDRLKHDGVVGFVHLCGPELGGDAGEDDNPRCGADLVYENTIEGTDHDCAGARRIRALAHSEDTITARTETGRALTSLIKGGHCKAEIAQLLVTSMSLNDLDHRLDVAGWRQHVVEWQKGARERQPELESDVYMLELGGEGSDPHACVVMALAPPPVTGGATLHTGAVTEFLARRFPGADYLFYCYGARLMVARRLNSANVTLDLSQLMPTIGSPSDGGHSGAAVCRPDANEAFPHQRLGKVTHANFALFVRYMVRRLSDAGFPVARVVDRSAPAARPLREGHNTLLLTVVAALTLGVILVIFFPRFRPSSILESNAEFLPQFDSEPREAGEGTEGGS